jgi:hypothetical protein
MWKGNIKSQTCVNFYPSKSLGQKAEFQDKINYLKKYNKKHWESILTQNKFSVKDNLKEVKKLDKDVFNVKIGKNHKMEI